MARLTDLIAELTASIAEWQCAAQFTCYSHKERSVWAVATRYGLRYTLAEVSACRDL